ncbi:MAG TPA: FtsX-like permease family protein [Blastocatellia bacterium]|nr:FtsX-like permease family protein [Blastocatellia bacterium]
MIKHLAKLVWNRRRANFLIAVEIGCSFIVLFVVVAVAVSYAGNYRRPLGFDYENVWNIEIDMKQRSDNAHTPEQVTTVRQLYLALKEYPEIEAATGAHTSPFSANGSYGSLEVNGRELEYRRNEVTDDFNQVLSLTLASGRWFGKEDDGVNWQPVVINQQLAQAVFGPEDPVGRDLPAPGQQTKLRVIGLITNFRYGGELSGSENLAFFRKQLDQPRERPPRNLLIKLRPQTSRAFDEKLVRRLSGIANQWSFDIRPMVELRETGFRQKLMPLIAAGIVAVFLMIMVALGLTGVLWQNVTQRTREIGLRRADGATVWHIYQQILGELLIIASCGLIVGVVVVIQFPLFDLVGWINREIYALSIVISLAAIYLLTIVCGLYPSWLAAKVQPAVALRGE